MMDITLNPYSIPAFVALAVKVAIFYYARRTSTSHPRTQLFLLFLFALALQNVGELFTYYSGIPREGVQWLFGGYVFFGASLAALALFVHFVLVLVRGRSIGLFTVAAVYGPMLVLQYFLWMTPDLVRGFEPHAFTWTRVPGPLYPALTLWCLAGLILGLTLLRKHASRKDTSAPERSRARWIFYSALPMIVLPIVVLGLQAIGINRFSLVLFFPLTVTVFLIASAYATYEIRLFDIDFFVPWSRMRTRSTAFHRRIQACVSALNGATGTREALQIVSRMLQCPVALVSAGEPVVAGGPGASRMAGIPASCLRNTDDFVVRREITARDPALAEAMQSHQIAAIVAFHADANKNPGWLLVGDVFDKQLVTPLDFRRVENLFDLFGERFLDRISGLQEQVTALSAEVTKRDLQIAELSETLHTLRDSTAAPRTQSQDGDVGPGTTTIDIDRIVERLAGPVITYVGRDRTVASALRERFIVVQPFASATAKKFESRQPEDILVVHASDVEAVLQAIGTDPPAQVVVWGATEEDSDGYDDELHVVVNKSELVDAVASLRQGRDGARPCLDDLAAEFETTLLKKTLEHCNGNQANAARALGLAQNTLHYKLGRHGLLRTRPRPRSAVSRRTNKASALPAG